MTRTAPTGAVTRRHVLLALLALAVLAAMCAAALFVRRRGSDERLARQAHALYERTGFRFRAMTNDEITLAKRFAARAAKIAEQRYGRAETMTPGEKAVVTEAIKAGILAGVE